MIQENQIIADLNNLEKVSRFLLDNFSSYKIITFHGDLGSGKTTLIKNICKLLNVKDEVSSPTFSLVNEYHTVEGSKLFHFDFYRIKDEMEALDMGVEEYFDSGEYCLIEWPERIESFLPEERLEVFIEIHEEQRNYNIKGKNHVR